MATGRPNGRPPKPAAQKVAEGNKHKGKMPEVREVEEVQRDGSIPEPPPGIGIYGLMKWDQLWDSSENLDSKQDRFIIEMLCLAYDDFYLMDNALKLGAARGGVDRTYKMTNGARANHPYVAQLKDLRVMISSYLAALAFSPTDRARLGLLEVASDDTMERFRQVLEQRRKEQEDSYND